jgi:PPOX class probable F420-dependent enzyme
MLFDDDSIASQRLDTDIVAWLTTVRPNGQPQASPIWFLRRGDELLVYSLPDTARVSNITANPRVAVNLDGDHKGGDIVSIEGVARIALDEPPASAVPEYVAKYRARMDRNGWTPEVFSAKYSTPIVINMRRGRAW